MANYNIPNVFAPYTPADAEQVNDNFSAIATTLNSNGLDQTGLALGSVVTSKILDQAVTTAKLADSSITTAKLGDGEVTAIKNASEPELSSTTGNLNTLLYTATYSQVVVSSIPVTSTLQCGGRPVLVQIQPDGATTDSSIQILDNSGAVTSAVVNFALVRDTTFIAYWQLGVGIPLGELRGITAGTTLKFVDTGATAGLHTYSIYYQIPGTASQAYLRNLKLVTFEL